MARSTHSHSHPIAQAAKANRASRRRLGRLRHLHVMSPERQAALVEEARAARRTEQERRTAEHAETSTLFGHQDREGTHGSA
jgi:hypothetical protein